MQHHISMHFNSGRAESIRACRIVPKLMDSMRGRYDPSSIGKGEDTTIIVLKQNETKVVAERQSSVQFSYLRSRMACDVERNQVPSIVH